jgi:PAS domain S-box-containing protein
VLQKYVSTRDLIRRAALIFLPLALITATILLLLYRAQAEASRLIMQANERNTVAIGAGIVSARLTEVVSDLAYLPEQWIIRQWAHTHGTAAADAIAGNFLAFAKYKTIYDQIRLLDPHGSEIVRVNWNGGAPQIVPKAALQNKADRYYVRATLALEPGQIYISPLDLNVEHGGVERPLKPAIRFGIPIFDKAGQERALIVLNYLAQHLLDRLVAISLGNPGDTWLLNETGYWLLGSRREDEWGFLFPERNDRSLARANPDAWATLSRSSDTGQFILNGELFTFEKIKVSQLPRLGPTTGYSAPDAPRLILVRHVAAAQFRAPQPPVKRDLALAGGAIFLLLAVTSLFVARHWSVRQSLERMARRNEQLFRALLESAPDAVVIVNSGGRVVLANAETERLFGYRRHEIVGQSIDLLVPERLRAAHGDHRKLYMAAPRTRAMGAGMPLFGLRRDGGEIPIAVSLSPVETPDGSMVFCDIRDMTDYRRNEGRIRELNERLLRENAMLESVNKELEAFSYSVSHDLRAPLRAIDGFAQALTEDYASQLDEAAQSHLSRVRSAAQRMGLIIDDLLNLSRVARAEISVQDVDLSALAQEIATLLAQGEPARRVTLAITPDLHVRGDLGMLRRAMVNLVTNAWKFSKDRETTVIAFGCDRQGGERVYFVRDNGVGFDMAYAGKLFGAFQRIHDASAFPGTGIGLAIVQRIVHKHGGRIWAHAEPDKGATFFFTLPEREPNDE